MRLANPADVLSALNIQSGAGPLASAGAALDATFSNIEAHLDTVLRRQIVVDDFNVYKAERIKPVLRLSRGFVDPDEPLVVTATTGFGTSLVTTVLDATDYRVDYRKGLVYVLAALPLSDMQLIVSYASGFYATSGVLAEVPDALVQAHLCLGCAFMQMNPPSVPKGKAVALGRAAIWAYQQQAIALMAQDVRPRACCLWADVTVAEDD